MNSIAKEMMNIAKFKSAPKHRECSLCRFATKYCRAKSTTGSVKMQQKMYKTIRSICNAGKPEAWAMILMVKLQDHREGLTKFFTFATLIEASKWFCTVHFLTKSLIVNLIKKRQ